ncbi:hypothetical protein AUR04nite_00530 [Glutamicibacter uratoxydans]|uniref:Uncharacterized protein n=1 Tax=Glutamicibacter uratoxydans TaxID=43667 RepID=A0A4Y4DPM2_GLUUR|nr:hypothetical protein [Glutamicibacter uratoxydans]GED04521.1 hypothetical protein AUR04nite_00530 [Glutamicibacter uratoxydans]
MADPITISNFGDPVDLLLHILEPLKAKGVHVYPGFEDDMELPAVVPLISRRSGEAAFLGHDIGEMRVALLELNTITEGPDADSDCHDLQEACRKLIVEAWLNQTEVPGVGVINRITNTIIGSAVSDWQTSTGVVQYANLPAGAQRFEAVYRLLIRPPRSSKPVNRFI